MRSRSAGTLLACLAAVAACSVGDAGGLGVADENVPVALLEPDTATHIAVVFHADHCLTCDLLGV